MPQAQSLTHPHEMASLVISPAPHSQQPQEVSPQSRPGRPKLSLNTAQTRTFGKGSSLRLETLSAISPTIINTFSNAYDQASRPPASSSEQKLTRPKLSIDSSIQYKAPETPNTAAESQASRTPSSASTSSASTANSATLPYSNSQILNSILANSPIPRLEPPRRMAARPRFPAEKKVSFRTPLEEEIITTRFTYAHYDVESPASGSTASLSTMSTSSEESIPDTASPSPSGSSESLSSSSHSSQRTEGSYLKRSQNNLSVSVESTSPLRSPPSPAKRRLPHRGRNKLKMRSPQTGDKRDSSSESDSDTCPETPVAGRRKLNRDWVWTLGTLPEQSSTQTSTDESTTTTSSSASFNSSIASSTRSDESS